MQILTPDIYCGIQKIVFTNDLPDGSVNQSLET